MEPHTYALVPRRPKGVLSQCYDPWLNYLQKLGHTTRLALDKKTMILHPPVNKASSTSSHRATYYMLFFCCKQRNAPLCTTPPTDGSTPQGNCRPRHRAPVIRHISVVSIAVCSQIQSRTPLKIQRLVQRLNEKPSDLAHHLYCRRNHVLDHTLTLSRFIVQSLALTLGPAITIGGGRPQLLSS